MHRNTIQILIFFDLFEKKTLCRLNTLSINISSWAIVWREISKFSKLWKEKNSPDRYLFFFFFFSLSRAQIGQIDGKESNLAARQAIAILIVGGRIAASNNTAIFRVAMHCSIVDASHSETLFPKRASLRLIAAQISLSFKHPGANNRSSRPRFRDSRNRQLNPPGYCGDRERLIASSKKTISISWHSFFFHKWTDTPDYVFLTIKRGKLLDWGYFFFFLILLFLCNFYFK